MKDILSSYGISRDVDDDFRYICKKELENITFNVINSTLQLACDLDPTFVDLLKEHMIDTINNYV